MNELRIGTRGSKLALLQAQIIVDRLCRLYPDLRTDVRVIRTRGDMIEDVPLQRVGGKGFFVKEIELALLNGEIDIAVHSAKDLPTSIPDGLTIAAICDRIDPRDAIVVREAQRAIEAQEGTSDMDILGILPTGAIVGTSSLRRHAQLLHLRPDLVMRHMRGNVDTRLRKLDEGGFDAIVVAAAALIRLGLEHKIAVCLPVHVCTPAAGQGALAIEARYDDERVLNLIKPLDDERARAEVEAERALVSSLGAGCHVPVGACAKWLGNGELELTAAVASHDGKLLIRRMMRGAASKPRELGTLLAEALMADGAEELLSSNLRSSKT